MKLTATISLLALILLGFNRTALAPNGFDHTEKCHATSSEPGKRKSRLPKHVFILLTLTAWSRCLQFPALQTPREISTAKYEFLDDPNAPTADLVQGNRQEPNFRPAKNYHESG